MDVGSGQPPLLWQRAGVLMRCMIRSSRTSLGWQGSLKNSATAQRCGPFDQDHRAGAWWRNQKGTCRRAVTTEVHTRRDMYSTGLVCSLHSKIGSLVQIRTRPSPVRWNPTGNTHPHWVHWVIRRYSKRAGKRRPLQQAVGPSRPCMAICTPGQGTLDLKRVPVPSSASFVRQDAGGVSAQSPHQRLAIPTNDVRVCTGRVAVQARWEWAPMAGLSGLSAVLPFASEMSRVKTNL